MCGIGGNRIEDTWRNLSNWEVNIWRAYRAKRGSLFVGRRVEQAIGNLMAFYHNGKVKPEDHADPNDFMPHEDEVETTFEEEAMKRRKRQQAI
ncbi:hypothetical protein KSA96_14920 [Acinetobacter pittii]|nr:hypothetical protein [Acinetobacter pittii]